MADSFFFYDLETSGLNPREARIMQFAGQRTDMNLQPIGDPVDVLIRLNPDVLPEPEAVLLTGITPQSTLQDGLSEAEFLQFFYEQVVQPGTTFLGYNTVRFDDEFMRNLHYRNLYDPYRWQWADGCSRWDVLDVVRMTRALRPEAIVWPVTPDGKATNRLELLTKANQLDHDHAHDALNDVLATIAVAALLKDRQPELWNYLYEHRGKKAVADLIEGGKPFVYTSGRYGSTHLNTTAAILLSKHAEQDSALVYDLRFDPTPFIAMTVEQLVNAWRYKRDRAETDPRLPVKTLKYNRCPAIAPMGVMKPVEVQQRLELSVPVLEQYLAQLRAAPAFTERLQQVIALLDRERSEPPQAPTDATVDGMLYAGFMSPSDMQTARAIHVAEPAAIDSFADKLRDARLKQLLPLYKARNFPDSLSAEERQAWDQHVRAMLFDGGQRSRATRYFANLQSLAQGKLTSNQEFLIEELQLYGESILPSDLEAGETPTT